jgi:hypothetical protein
MEDTNTKALIFSATFQGAIVSLLGLIFSFFQIPIGTEELGAGISAVFILGGLIYSVIGRIKATKEISGVFTK